MGKPGSKLVDSSIDDLLVVFSDLLWLAAQISLPSFEKDMKFENEIGKNDKVGRH